MSAPQGAGRSVVIRLLGYVTLQDVCTHVGDIWRKARQQRGVLFALDSSAVIDFSTLALTALGRLRKHLHEFGCDLALVRCSPSVIERGDDPLVAPLLTPHVPTAEPQIDMAKEGEVPEAPAEPPAKVASVNRVKPAGRREGGRERRAPRHVKLLVLHYQRYWLN
jgi:hypothetical protein